jgi:DNA polymerase
VVPTKRVSAPVARPSEPEVASPAPVAPVVSAPVDDAPPQWLDEIPLPQEEQSPTAEPQEPSFYLEQDEDIVATLNWNGLRQRVSQCEACELHKARTQTVFGEGDPEADLMVIGEAPGAEEDRQGAPLVGPTGKLFDAMLQAIGFRRDQVYITNIIKCRTPGNRDPHADEVQHCQAYLKRQVALVKPRVILSAGRVAAQSLLSSAEAVGRLRGKEASYQGIPVVVTYHPAYLLRSPEQKAKAWQDLQRLVGRLKS